MMKSDLGINIFLAITFLIFDSQYAVYIILDSINLIVGIVLVILNKRLIGAENKKCYIVLGVRLIFEVYTILRVISLMNITDSSPERKKYFHNDFMYGVVTVIGAGKFCNIV